MFYATGFNNSSPSQMASYKTLLATPAKPAPSAFVSTSINFEKRVLRKMKSVVRENKTQFRSVSALANFHLAKALGLDL